MMPEQTRHAIEEAIQQTIETERGSIPISLDMPHVIVDRVREYFNTNNIDYNTFSYDDLVPFMQLSE